MTFDIIFHITFHITFDIIFDITFHITFHILHQIREHILVSGEHGAKHQPGGASMKEEVKMVECWLVCGYWGDPGNCLSFVNAIKVNRKLLEHRRGIGSHIDVMPQNQS